MTGADKYRVEALSLKVAPDSEASVAQVDMSKSNRVVVTAKSGVVKVSNSAGMLVAMVFPGKALEFDPQAGGPATATKISGVLVKRNGKFLLVDTTTNVTFEVQGDDLGKYVGKSVEVTGVTVDGVTPAPGATQVLHATMVTRIGGGAGGAVPAGGVKTGMATGKVVAIVGGVIVGGTVGGLAAAGAFSGSGSVSRP